MTDRRAALYAVILAAVGGVIGASIAWSAIPPEVVPVEVEVPYHWTSTVTATATVTKPAPTVTVTRRVSRDQSRKPVPTGSTVWDRLAKCESGGRWNLNVGFYDGGLQFHPTYWPHYARLAGVTDKYAWQATREEQIMVAEVMKAERGWKPWPHCSAQLGLG